MKLTKEDLQNLIKQAVQEEVAPLKETQRKYAEKFQVDEKTAKEMAEEKAAKDAELNSKGETVEPGIRLARSAKLMVLAKNDPEKALHIAEKNLYPEDKHLHAAFKALAASTPTDGGFLIPEQYSDEIIPLLRNKAVVRAMGARPLPLNGGNLNIPRMLGGATSYYVGENQDAKASKPSFGNLRLSSKKLVTMVPISNDLIRSTSPEADRMIRDDMIKSMALAEDYAALYGKGTEYTPRGIMNTQGITKKKLNAIPDSDALGDFVGTLMTKNIDWNNVGWIFNGKVWNILYHLKTTTGAYLHRDELNQGKFLGFPYKVTNQIPFSGANEATDIFFGDFAEFIIGEEMGLEMMASSEATYLDGNELVSAFSRDQTVIKVTAKHDFGVRHPEAFVVGTDVYTKQ
jgi:HK97 family phage major capsid protein